MTSSINSRGIRTWVSLEPVIDPEQSIELIKQTHEFVDLYKVGKLNHDPLADTIDWRRFGWDAKGLLESLKKAHYIKQGLRALM